MYDEHDKPEIAAELTALEQQLAHLAPTIPRIDRDQLMYDAGSAAALAQSQPRRLGYIAEPSWLGRRFWQAATAFATAASLILAAMLVRQHDRPQIADSAATFQDSAAVSDESNDSRTDLLVRPDRMPSGYLGVRYVALTEGVGMLDLDAPPTNNAPSNLSPPANSRQLLKELLPDHELPNS